MTTHIADYTYILKELPKNEGTASDWAIECSPNSEQLPFIDDFGTMYIRLKTQTTENEANELRKQLTAHSANFTVVTS